MTHTVHFTPEARDQLDKLEADISGAASPAVAARYVDSIVDYCQNLQTFPHRGTRRDDLRPGLRTLGFRRRVTILFEVAGDTVNILGVYYGRVGQFSSSTNIPGRSMPSSSCHTVLAESFFRRNAELFRPHLAAVGLREQILSAPESEIPVTKYVALWEVLGSEVSPTIGLEVAMRTESSELGAYGHAIRCAPSMQLVLRSLSRFMVVLTQATQLDFEDNGKRISLAYRVTDASIVQRRQDAEFTICTILNLLREVTRNPQLSPVRVDFEHRAPSDLASHREVFGCPIRFEQPDNRLYFSRELLDMPIRTADQRLFQALEPFLEQQRQSRAASTDVLSQVAHHIASSLSSGCASLEQVASDLKIGVRTLQRRLAEQNVEFSQLVEDVRRSLAESYVMQSDYSLTEIALLLGYSEASSFCRAFRRWTQLTPQQFRQRGRS